MFSDSAAWYDAVYATIKDYPGESARLAALVRRRVPGARTLLDVGCGTGEHARHLAGRHGFEVEGLDLDPAMLAVARRKLPALRFVEADLASFDMGRRYDVLACLFGAIGYLDTADRVRAAFRCFRRHLAPGGLVVVEPWLTPDAVVDGKETSLEAPFDGGRVTRTTRTEVAGRVAVLHFRYRVEDAAGVRSLAETHRMGLYTTAELLAAFAAAGLAATHDPVGLTGRGLFVAAAAAAGGA